MSDHVAATDMLEHLPRPPRRRRGFLLPFVLVTLLLVSAICGAAGLAGWRAMRAARLAWNGERASQAADEALAMAAGDWDADAFSDRAIGARWSRSIRTADGADVTVALARTAPLAVAMEAQATSRVSGSPDTARRRVARMLALQAPRFPVLGALTALDTLYLDGAAIVDGRDALMATDGCAPQRDSAAVPGVYAGRVSVGPSVAVQGSLPVLAPGPASGEILAARAAFDSAWRIALSRVRRRDAVGAGASLPTARPWSARHVTATDTVRREVVLDGLSTHDGLLLVDGDLRVQGTLLLRGLLVVGGALDVTVGRLDIQGAVVSRDGAARASHGGDGVRVRYSPCTVLRALAAVAHPAFAPYGTWVTR